MTFTMGIKNKRRPLLLNKTNEVKDEPVSDIGKVEYPKYRNYSIGVAALVSGAGGTFVALNIANELSLNYKVALLELDFKNELKGFKDIYKTKEISKAAYSLGSLDVYTYGANITDILHKDYEFIVLDAGSYYKYNENREKTVRDRLAIDECMRADKRFMVVNITEWRQSYISDFILQAPDAGGWEIIVNMPEEKSFKEFKDLMTHEKFEVYSSDYLSGFTVNQQLAKKILK